ncbi:phosphoenolpyruvate mutase [Salinihabitans flavidus]|uniref:phosphoenolpyruvate mutase n=1 Tax=Salinihabitans flavidus TaxID=569882 RepID=A0A1H8QVP3_9RHOB|nr:phosphoenolpyruvate mutase [Salinihabitans flavidus]SEO57998.1 phosphoenolpyruvate mutase [Salinihabitans flavidus]
MLQNVHHYRPDRFTRLRDMLTSKEPRFLMEAHDGLSAKIAQEAGFEGLWASGLSISAALGVRDNNELSWTQVLAQLEYMNDAVDLPILVDGDTGYGNFNNFRRFVAKLCERGIAGVCIEDKLFPKTNSFLEGSQTLASVEEFCGKIKAGKDIQSHPDFSIVARIEALISGAGMEEALMRAAAYADAGADALVIHSKKADPDEILEFLDKWDHRVPVILIPTKYYRTPTKTLTDAGGSLVIWANHNMRAAMQAMRETCATIMRDQSLVAVEAEVAPLADVFALAGNEELERAEAQYLAAQPDTSAIILAASRGTELAELTRDRPKCMLNVRGATILDRQLSALTQNRVEDVAVIVGYRHEAVETGDARKLVNDAYETTGEVASLALARDMLTRPAIISYGDILFQPFFVDLLRGATGDFTLLVDPEGDRPDETGTRKPQDLVKCSAPFSGLGGAQRPALMEIADGLVGADGKWVGLMGCSARGARKLAEEIASLEEGGLLATADLPMLLTRLMARGEVVDVIYVTGNWVNVNDLADLSEARNAM